MTGGVPQLEKLVRRVRCGVYLVALVVVLVLEPLVGTRTWPTVALLVAAVAITRTRLSMSWVLSFDLALALGLWWLFGPVSGAGFIPYAVVSVAPLIMPRVQAKGVLVVAVVSVATTAGLHALAHRASLPLFHPPGGIPDGEFFAGVTIQAIILLGVGVLMMRIAGSLREGREALATDLERQQELHRLKDGFLATVSHQLRTPLTVLRGFSNLLLELEPETEERREYDGLIAEQVDEMHTLVEDLITFNRIEAGEFSVVVEPVEVKDSILTTVGEMGARAGDVQVDVTEGVSVMADPARLAQIVRNLVDNALKYGVPPVVVRGRVEEGWFLCRVSDGGPGLGPIEVKSAFEPHVRLVANATMSEPGLGLGLTIAKELVERHGGELRYVDRDSGFEFRLPLAPVRSQVPAEHSAA